MSRTEIEAQLAEAEERFSALNQRLDEIIESYRNQLPGLAEPWIRAEVERRITDNAEKVEALGLERLKNLKSGLADLISRLPQIARVETEDRSDWPHYRVQTQSANDRTENEAFFDKAFRSVISHAGALLHQFGLIAVPKGYVQVWEDRGNGKYRYGINPGFMDLTVPSRDSFHEALREWKPLKRQVDQLRQQLAQTRAKELWDSA